MGSNSSSYISGLTHPSGWLHNQDEIVLWVGMALWWVLTFLQLVVLVIQFHLLNKRPLVLAARANIIFYTLILAVVYMFTNAKMFFWVREDKVIVRTLMVLLNGGIQLLLIHSMSVFAVLTPVHANWVWKLGLISTALTVLASFTSAGQQWAGWAVGAACDLPIPFLWISTQRRTNHGQRFSPAVVGGTVVWICYRLCYAVLQLTGHTFAGSDGLPTTVELALTLVLHTATLIPLFVWASLAKEGPLPPGRTTRALANGDELHINVES